MLYVMFYQEIDLIFSTTHDFKKSKKKNIIMNVNYGHYIIFIFIYRSCRGVLIDICE